MHYLRMTRAPWPPDHRQAEGAGPRRLRVAAGILQHNIDFHHGHTQEQEQEPKH